MGFTWKIERNEWVREFIAYVHGHQPTTRHYIGQGTVRSASDAYEASDENSLHFVVASAPKDVNVGKKYDVDVDHIRLYYRVLSENAIKRMYDEY